MGILDDAIREHIDLKRRHGARDAELRELEDEAFGSTDQPDPFAAGNELFTEVSPTATGEETAAGTASALSEPDMPDIGGEEPTRLVEPEALRTSEPAPEEPELDFTDEPVTPDEPVSPPEGLEQIPGQTELPGQDEIPGQESLDDVAEPPSPSEPPSRSESLAELIADEEPFPEDADAPEPPEPAAPESSVPDPPPPPPAAGPEPPGRARGRVDVPTQEHPPPGQTGDLPPFPSESPDDEPAGKVLPADEPEPAEEPGLETGSPELFDFETDEEHPPSTGSTEDDFEALGPAEEDAPHEDEERPYADEPGSGSDVPLDEPSTAVRPALEDEEAYEGGGPDPEESFEEDDEDLWFEKGPPKDFDFDD